MLGTLVLHRLENANDPEFTKRLGDWLRRELPGFQPAMPTSCCLTIC
jgi:hypothetical protein